MCYENYGKMGNLYTEAQRVAKVIKWQQSLENITKLAMNQLIDLG